MLVLKSNDVQYCHKNESLERNNTEITSLCYQKICFKKVSKFTSKQLEEAIEICRQFLDLERPICALIVTETDSITVWRESI